MKSILRNKNKLALVILPIVVGVITLLTLYLVDRYNANQFVQREQAKAEIFGSALGARKLESVSESDIQRDQVEKINENRFIRELPPTNSAVGKVNKVVIEKIGVDAEIFESDDSDSALKKGAWIVNDFNTPIGSALYNGSKPTIISSHLYGPRTWSREFRERVSFAGLDRLEYGDTVEVTWGQRQFIYTIVDGEVSDQISSYDYDLILYTCNDLDGSDLRVVRYANLIN